MEIIENTTEFHLEKPSAVALGKFDGIHLGHRRLLDKVLEQKKRGMQTVVFTFDTSAGRQRNCPPERRSGRLFCSWELTC